jgi:hypothetical protein
MLFAASNYGMDIFAMLVIFGVWSIYFFWLREKPEDKGK